MTPALLRRSAAADYLGVGTTTFDTLRERKDFPRPVWVTSDPRWQRDALDAWAMNLATSNVRPSQVAPAPATAPVRHRRSRHGDSDLAASPTDPPLRAVT